MKAENLIRVAMIDDHDLLRNGICRFLEGIGFETVFEAENGKIALEKLQNISVLPDVCIVDINMPVMNGHETAKAIKRFFPQIKLLAFSVNDDEKDVKAMVNAGVDGYILKGADPDELENAILVVYNGDMYFSAGVKEVALKILKDPTSHK